MKGLLIDWTLSKTWKRGARLWHHEVRSTWVWRTMPVSLLVLTLGPDLKQVVSVSLTAYPKGCPEDSFLGLGEKKSLFPEHCHFRANHLIPTTVFTVIISISRMRKLSLKEGPKESQIRIQAPSCSTVVVFFTFENGKNLRELASLLLWI